MKIKRAGWFTRGVFGFTLFFFYAPLAMLVAFSFNDARSMNWGGASLRWYRELFLNSRGLWGACLNSVEVALGSALAATVIGTLGAIGMYWYDFRYKRALRIVAYLPLLMPEIIIGVSLLIFFAGIRLPLSLFTVFAAHTTFNIPFVLLIVMARLEEFDFSIVEAAYDLGAGELAALTRVIVPVSLPGILAGFLMAVTLSLEDFVITFFVAGPGCSTLPLHIYSMIRFGVSPAVNALSVVLIAATILLVFFSRNLYKLILKG